VSTYSNRILAGHDNLNVNDGWVNRMSISGGSSYSYTPADQAAPPYPRSVGQTWSGSGVLTDGTTTATFTETGQIIARETLEIPAGTFDSYRAENTFLMVATSTSFVHKSTCWYSVQRGVLLKCDSTATDASTTPSYVESTSQALTGLGGLGGPNRASLGNVLPRFTGSWRVQYSGGNSGNCAQLAVTASGSISGSCTAASGSTFNVTGSVNDQGAVTLALSTGGSLTGTLTTPYSGQGTWVDGSLSGTWTASHI
jgi:hypothetical protein